MPHLQMIDPGQAQGALQLAYERMRSRPMPPVYQPVHGGVAGIIRGHSLDAELLPLVFSVSANLNGQGPLTWPLRELVNTLTSRLNQCFY